MSSSPQDYLEAARLINHSDCTEASIRAVVSRAYYAAYHAARVYHTSLAVPGSVGLGKPGGKHQELIAQLRNPMVPGATAKAKSRTVGNTLNAARILRVQADYSPDSDMSETEAADALSKAQQLCEVAAAALELES